MKYELKHLATVDSEHLAKNISRRIYKRCGVNVQWRDSSDSTKYSVDLIDDGTITQELLSYINGYVVGLLEFLEPRGLNCLLEMPNAASRMLQASRASRVDSERKTIR